MNAATVKRGSRARKGAKGNATTSSGVDKPRLVRGRNAVLQPVTDILLADRAVTAAGKLGLRAGKLDSGRKRTDRATNAVIRHKEMAPMFMQAEAGVTSFTSNATTNKLVTQADTLAPMLTLGQVVRALREGNGWNQSELARRASRKGHKVAPQNIQQLESGEISQPRYLPALAETFGITLDELYRMQRVGVDVRQTRARAEEPPPTRSDDFVSLQPLTHPAIRGIPAGSPVFRASMLRERGWSTETHRTFSVPTAGMEPALVKHATTVVDTSDTTILSGEIYVIAFGGEVVARRLFNKPGGMVTVCAENRAAFPDIEAQAADVTVLGRVVCAINIF